MAPSKFAFPPTSPPVKSPIFVKGHDAPFPQTEQLQALLQELIMLSEKVSKFIGAMPHLISDVQPAKVKREINNARESVERSLQRVAERERGLKEERQHSCEECFSCKLTARSFTQ